MTRPLRVGHIKLSFHDAASEQVELVLRSHGHEIERSAAPHKDMFARLGRGEIDVLVVAWLPWSHGVFHQEIAEKVRPITVLYEPYAIWAVPDYVPVEVASIEDLLRTPAVDRMDRLIQGMAPGAGISEMSPKAVKAYGLDTAGYHFRNGTEDDCIGRLVEAVAEQRWIVTPFWRPQALHLRLNLRHLIDPKSVLGGTDNATVLVLKDSEELIGHEALADLSELYLGNSLTEILDEKIRRRRSTEYTDYSAVHPSRHVPS
ncbi:glycine betaine ABC transporter substrate-binding protein [Streptomyces sp. NPDC086091]|uniref:glycine betaine ABC transporter substrate-binding protein n=1 Tax=Streptomyces sp. NPDC086091 TaxID=3365751 RepID=UPI00382E9E62